MKFKQLIFSLFLLFSGKLLAHPMPYSVLLLDIKGSYITAELQFPLKEFQFVFPNEDIDLHPATLIERKDKWLDAYLLSHMSIETTNGQKWSINITRKSVREGEQNLTGKYAELTYQLTLLPPVNASTRQFIIHYDAIMHQLLTHKLWIQVRSDWEGGITAHSHTALDLGILGVNFTDNSIPPVVIQLDEGSTWKGFTAMLNLGMEHIAEGTDHLLFLLVLLLPATLTVEQKRWAKFAGMKYSCSRLLRITIAFTIGHSLTLLVGSLGWVKLPQQPVEVCIALTIIITAIHAIRPLFPNKEIYVAGAFGLIHGLAFASILADLQLDAGKMALSILGFNIGIELMQLFVILLTIPWLIVISDKVIYTWLRISGAVFAFVAALGWMAERIFLKSNSITEIVQAIANQNIWLVLGLASVALLSVLYENYLSRKVR